MLEDDAGQTVKPDRQPTRRSKPFSWLSLFKLVAGLGLLVLSLWGIRWSELSVAIASVKLSWVLVALVSMAVSLLVKAGRWWLLLRNYGVTASFRRVSEAFFIGLVVNLLAPARGGDIVRLGLLSARQPPATAQIAATIALEKFLDLLTLVLIALMVAAYLPPEGEVWLREWLMPVSGLALLGLLLILFVGPQLWGRIAPRFDCCSQSWIKRGVAFIDQFVESSLWLREKARLWPLIAVTVLVWFTMWLNNAVLFRSLALDLPVSAGLLVLVLSYVRMLLALPTGSVGPFYFFAQLSLTTFSIADESALAFAILLHALVTLTPILVGGSLLLASQDARNLTRALWKKKT